AEAAWIEKWNAGRAARAPVFGDAIFGGETELFVELAIRQTAQSLLVEERYPLPFLGVAQPVEIDMVESVRVESRAPRLFHGAPLAPPLDLGNFCAGGRQR